MKNPLFKFVRQLRNARAIIAQIKAGEWEFTRCFATRKHANLYYTDAPNVCVGGDKSALGICGIAVWFIAVRHEVQKLQPRTTPYAQQQNLMK